MQLDGTGKVSMALNDGKTVTNYKGIAVDMEGKEVGADEQMSKPEIGHLVQVIDHLLDHPKR